MAKLSKEVSEFTNKVLVDKREQLMGIALDIRYWEDVIAGYDEDELRKELEAEGNKRTIDRMGKVLKDDRDMQRIEVLNKSINEVAEAKQKLTQLKDIRRQVERYVKHVQTPSDAAVKEMQDVVDAIKVDPVETK